MISVAEPVGAGGGGGGGAAHKSVASAPCSRRVFLMIFLSTACRYCESASKQILMIIKLVYSTFAGYRPNNLISNYVFNNNNKQTKKEHHVMCRTYFVYFFVSKKF